MKGGRALGKALDSRLRGNDDEVMNVTCLGRIRFGSGLHPRFMRQEVI